MDNRLGLALLCAFIAVVLYIPIEVHGARGCYHGFTLRNNHTCYMFVINRNSSWQDAENYCESRYGHLVVIEDAAEQKFLDDYFKNNTAKYRTAKPFWTSGTKANYGRWYWFWTARLMHYTNWATNQPDNHGGKELCVDYGPRRGYKWTDSDCNTHNDFICEYSDYDARYRR